MPKRKLGVRVKRGAKKAGRAVYRHRKEIESGAVTAGVLLA